VAKQDRAVVFVNNVVSFGDRGAFAPLYQFLESSAPIVLRTELGLAYREVRELSGNSATVSQLVSTLGALQANAAIKAIDVVISLHGQPDRLCFVGSPACQRVEEIADQIADARTQQCQKNGQRDLACERDAQRKLRVVYSAACYGASHIKFWTGRAGFAAAAGAEGVHTDSAASFPTFLTTWRSGYSFSETVARANRADGRRLYDIWARQNPDWRDANSNRLVYATAGANAGVLSINQLGEQAIACAREGQMCEQPGRNTIFYGAQGKFVTRVVIDRISCSNAAFGTDPAPNLSKACFVSQRR
jgi:hypothetical protein